MKNLLLCFIFLALTGCDENPLKPDFEVGDCIVYEDNESWEKDNGYKRILQIGKDKYRYEYLEYDSLKGLQSSEYIRWMDRLYKQTECPNEQ